MTPLSEQFRETADYIGTLWLSHSGTQLIWERFEGYRRKDIIAFGDVVYFLFLPELDNELVKIGMSASKNGFEGRVTTYKRSTCATSRKVLDGLKAKNVDQIDVYAIPLGREEVADVCPITGEVLRLQLSKAREYEKRYTKLFLEENSKNQLPFCKQIG